MNLNLLILLLGVAIVIAGQIHLIAFNVTSFEEGAKSEGAAFYFDKKFIPVMDEISAKVPQNETIVMSYNSTSLLDFFVKSKIEIPYGVTSLESLRNYMNDKKLTWLLVYENVSHTRDLESLFNKSGLRQLESDFQKIDEYTTETMTKFHLYRLKPQIIT
jgi:Trm5-related predicted tRNA methylase